MRSEQNLSETSTSPVHQEEVNSSWNPEDSEIEGAKTACEHNPKHTLGYGGPPLLILQGENQEFSNEGELPIELRGKEHYFKSNQGEGYK